MTVNIIANVSTYINGMDNAALRSHQARTLGTAKKLGYHTYEEGELVDLRNYVLPARWPFLRIWPFTLVRELILDHDGRETYKNGKLRTRWLIRWLP